MVVSTPGLSFSYWLSILSSLYTLLTFTDPYTPRSDSDTTRVEQPHMDVENEPRGGSEEDVEETNMPQVSASVSENRLCEPNTGRDRTIISTHDIDRPHGDDGQGEFRVGGEVGRAPIICISEQWRDC